MTSFERYLYNQKTTNELKQLIERMLENEQKSSSECTQERKEAQAQSGETRSQIVVKRFDDYHYEEDLKCGLMKHWL
jgi:hypothetical protein